MLGLLLWNICFDTVLIAAVPNGEHSVCCADDTQLIAEGISWTRTLWEKDVADAAVDMGVKNLCLKTSFPQKTEFLWINSLPKGVPLEGPIKLRT